MRKDRCFLLGFVGVLAGAIFLFFAYYFSHYAPEDFSDSIQRTPQNALHWVDPKEANTPLIAHEEQNQLSQNYLSHYFSPWSLKKTDQFLQLRAVILGTMKNAAHYPGRGINHLFHSRDWINALINNSDMNNFPNTHQPVINITDIDLRLLPTQQPQFGNFHQAGEGYPFDYFQATHIAANTPAMLIQKSRDGVWSFIVTNNSYGWVPSQVLANVNSAFMHQWKTQNYIALTKNKTALIDEHGINRFTAGIGKIFPIDKNSLQKNNAGYTVLIAVANAEQQAMIKKAFIKKNEATAWPLSITQKNIADIMNAMLGVPYGWGGIDNDSDCSLTTMNLFATFGIWLPRNSDDQSYAGHVVSLNHMTNSEKMKMIIVHGKPFLTLLHIPSPGHIVVYIGEKNNRAYIFHTVWGVHTRDIFGKEGRAILGSTVITPVDLGKSDMNVNKTWLTEISSMVILN